MEELWPCPKNLEMSVLNKSWENTPKIAVYFWSLTVCLPDPFDQSWNLKPLQMNLKTIKFKNKYHVWMSIAKRRDDVKYLVS